MSRFPPFPRVVGKEEKAMPLRPLCFWKFVRKYNAMKIKLTALFILLLLAAPAFADWKLSQKHGPKGTPGMIQTIYVKGVRQRMEARPDIAPETAKAREEAKAMGVNLPGMANSIPTTTTACDVKQNFMLSDPNRTFYIDYLDPDDIPADKLARRKKVQIVRKGTLTIDAFVEDSGKRQMMFGLQARWLKFTTEMTSSADSCLETPNMKMVQEGWFVHLWLESESCPIRPQPDEGGCFPRLVVKRAASPGFMLTGTTTSYIDGKLTGSNHVETVDLSKATLDQALFEIPKDYYEVDSFADLMTARAGVDAAGNTILYKDGTRPDEKRRIAIDYFSGSASKLDQESLRNFIADKVRSAGHNGTVIGSAADLKTGTFANVIGVEIKKIKESGASKVGGLFGKVTGSDALAKAGKSQAEIVVTLYAADGKTVVARSPANVEVSGSSTDAVKAAIDQVIESLITKIK